jgi:hypothetical protein
MDQRTDEFDSKMNGDDGKIGGHVELRSRRSDSRILRLASRQIDHPNGRTTVTGDNLQAERVSQNGGASNEAIPNRGNRPEKRCRSSFVKLRDLLKR